MIQTTKEIPFENILHKQFSISAFSLSILVISFVLAVINTTLSLSYFFSTWDVIFYLLLIAPLAWMSYKKKLDNPYTIWMIPIALIWLFDIFYFNNDFTQYVLPNILFFFLVVLYLTSMHKVNAFYYTLIPSTHIPLKGLAYIKLFIRSLLVYKEHKSLYTRIGIALLLTLPVFTIFVLLFMSADSNFGNFIKSIFTFNTSFTFDSMILIPLNLIVYLLVFIYGFSNRTQKEISVNDKTFDPLIIGIFLGMLNLLFITFLLFQVNYLFGGETYLKESGINIAHFAREGFFQLAWVMGLVLSIFILLMSRFKGEKLITYFMSGLILQTIILGFSSLKKMYLYQSIMGATVLRYYVAWFDYFLIFVLSMGLYFILKNKSFKTLLDSVFIVGIVSFTLIASLNIDKMVASHNINKFTSNTQQLDKQALSKLSIDALPSLVGTDIRIKLYGHRDCSAMNQYHLGYCMLLSNKNVQQNTIFSKSNRIR